MDPRVHLEMGLLRLVNAARLAPLEELLADLGNSTSSRPAGGGSAPKTSSSAARSASASAATASSPVWSAPAEMPRAVPPAPAFKSEIPAPRPAVVASSFPSPGSGAAAAAAPALKPVDTPALPKVETESAVAVAGITSEQVAEIKSAIQATQKFIGELLEHASRWELEGAELRIYFPPQKNTFAGLIEGRDTLEKIRASSNKVLGRAVRVCAKLDSGAVNDANASSRAASTQEMRAQFENDPMVKSMLQRFGGRISEVRRRTGD